jgi:hypothetical protein
MMNPEILDAIIETVVKELDTLDKNANSQLRRLHC